jgi:hypothetical protein
LFTLLIWNKLEFVTHTFRVTYSSLYECRTFSRSIYILTWAIPSIIFEQFIHLYSLMSTHSLKSYHFRKYKVTWETYWVTHLYHQSYHWNVIRVHLWESNANISFVIISSYHLLTNYRKQYHLSTLTECLIEQCPLCFDNTHWARARYQRAYHLLLIYMLTLIYLSYYSEPSTICFWELLHPAEHANRYHFRHVTATHLYTHFMLPPSPASRVTPLIPLVTYLSHLYFWERHFRELLTFVN